MRGGACGLTWASIVLFLALIVPSVSWCAAPDAHPGLSKSEPAAGKGHQILLETEHGTLTIELFPEVAPKTVARFTELVQKGFYNGLRFYRVLPKFLVQTGDPQDDGTGGSGRTLPAEFNDKKHVVGTVGMARRSDPDSGDSQFYICLEAEPFLDGMYTVFGQVVAGLDVLTKIKERDTVRKLTLN